MSARSGKGVPLTEREVSKADPADCSRCEWDCQCARCGSSVGWEDCQMCPATGWYGKNDPDCVVCAGTGVAHFCLSSADWCEANANPGRGGVERHTVEWFASIPCDQHAHPLDRERAYADLNGTMDRGDTDG